MGAGWWSVFVTAGKPGDALRSCTSRVSVGALALAVSLADAGSGHVQTSRAPNTVGGEVKNCLLGPPSIHLRQKDGRATLVLPFSDPFRRLLTHGLCQFYGLVSRSETQNDGTRPIHIHVGRSARRMQRHGLGLLSVHLLRVVCGVVDGVPEAGVGVGAGVGTGAGAGAGTGVGASVADAGVTADVDSTPSADAAEKARPKDAEDCRGTT